MPLPQGHREKLAAAVERMAKDGVPAEDIRDLISVYKTKYDVPVPSVPKPQGIVQPVPETKTAAGFGANVLKSGFNQITNLVESLAAPVVSPQQTAKALGGTALGALQLAIPGEQDAEKTYAQPIIDDYKRAYGGVDNIKETLYNDPFRVASDLSSILFLGAGAIPKVGKLAKVAERARKASEVANPLNIVIPTPNNTIVKGISQERKSAAADKLMRSALKVPTAPKEAANAEKAIRAAIREQILPNKKGAEKTQNLIDELDTTGDAMVDSHVAAMNQPGIIPNGATPPPAAEISLLRSLRYIDEVRDRAKKNMNPTAPLAAVDKVTDDLVQNHGNKVPLDFAHAMKKETASKAKYGERGSYENEALKAGVRGLKEEIALAVPGLDKVLAREADLIKLRPILERAISREGNKQLGDFTTPQYGTSGAVLTGNRTAGVVAGVLKNIMDRASVKGRLAISLGNEAARPPATSTALLNLLQLAHRPDRDYVTKDEKKPKGK
jgi:uncharacterized membrane protein